MLVKSTDKQIQTSQSPEKPFHSVGAQLFLTRNKLYTQTANPAVITSLLKASINFVPITLRNHFPEGMPTSLFQGQNKVCSLNIFDDKTRKRQDEKKKPLSPLPHGHRGTVTVPGMPSFSRIRGLCLCWQWPSHESHLPSYTCNLSIQLTT